MICQRIWTFHWEFRCWDQAWILVSIRGSLQRHWLGTLYLVLLRFLGSSQGIRRWDFRNLLEFQRKSYQIIVDCPIKSKVRYILLGLTILNGSAECTPKSECLMTSLDRLTYRVWSSHSFSNTPTSKEKDIVTKLIILNFLESLSTL